MGAATRTVHAGSAADEPGDPGRADGPVVLDRYRLLQRLGGGGMGVVWRAEDLKLGRQVAVKRIVSGDAETARRADRETVAAARLQHPAIVSLYESVAEDDHVWLISELVDGPTFAQALADGLLSDRDVLEIGIAMCDALAVAHREGVVHRDVKPQNILVCADGGGRGAVPAKLTDFGIARLAGDDAVTRTGDVVGTLAYMAPEQAEGRETGPAADCYALALCLYEGLSGVNPVRGRGAAGTARRVGQQLPALGRLRRDLPLELCEAIDDAVWPDPRERATLKELRAALRAALPGAADDPGTIAGAPIEPLAGGPDVAAYGWPLLTRIAAALLAAPAVPLALARTGDLLPGDARWAAPAVIALITLLLPRVGWLLAAGGSITLLAVAGDPWLPAAVLAAAPVPVLLRRAEPWSWSVPGAAVGLGVAGVAGATPALAVRIVSPVHRAAAGLLGAWWLLLAHVASGHGLVPGLAEHPGAPGLDDNGIAALVSSPALMFAATCVAGAVVAPWMVGSASTALAIAGALVWAAAGAVAIGVQAPHSVPELVAGAAVAAALVVVLRPSPAAVDDVLLP